MADFRRFAERVDEIARAARTQVQDAENRVHQAEAARLPKNGGTTPEYLARVATREADYQTALAQRDDLRRVLPEHVEREIESIRREMEAAITDTFAARPEGVDMATLTLLQSGILRPGEYERLLNDAIRANNYTMARMIGAAAEKAGVDAAGKYGQGDELAKGYRAVGYQAQRVGGEAYRVNFRVLQDTLNRCLKHSALWPKWEELTGEVIQKGF